MRPAWAWGSGAMIISGVGIKGSPSLDRLYDSNYRNTYTCHLVLLILGPHWLAGSFLYCFISVTALLLEFEMSVGAYPFDVVPTTLWAAHYLKICCMYKNFIKWHVRMLVLQPLIYKWRSTISHQLYWLSSLFFQKLCFSTDVLLK